ncbi:serine/threonine protein kinase [Thermodesulforhabdus norvegica]|uniref:Serine/threonine protein kinase n=1 Tax=Thermodesulforhabdus norvegica TaxID=39841 RepID=A0A1I4R0Y0_9BACT|nr:serine/threonine-protein kinase [Thermodesulforhabdus norvegica]SFM45974.1 Serine/threonine protein kinase [Thermodesulforhabdus norvegica]
MEKPKIESVLLLDLPENLQLIVMEAVASELGTEINILTSPSSTTADIIFAMWNNRHEGYLKTQNDQAALFVFLPPEEENLSTISEVINSREVADYAFADDTPERIKKRIKLFLNSIKKRSPSKAVKQLSTADRGLSLWRRFSDFALRMFRPRQPVVTPEMVSIIGGRWERVRRLGFGSFGEVWLVRRRGTVSEYFAVAKIPHESRINEKLLQEAEILRKLQDHPNAVGVIEVLEQGGKIVLIEEFVEGRTLQELMDEGMESAQKEQVFLQTVDLVAYAHEMAIMHRDIKPENIVVTSQGLVKVLDFGAAKDVSLRSVSSTVVGSRPFMAPEQILGQSRRASDVWALGVLLYALSTEYLPFYSEKEKELMDMILEAPPQRPRELVPEIPPELENIILRCLEKDPEKRYPHARALQKDLLEKIPEFGEGKVIP